MDPFREYIVESSPDLISWTKVTRTNVSAVLELQFFVTNGLGGTGFFRAHDVTGSDVVVYPSYAYPSTPGNCWGTSTGGFEYRPVASAFPFQPIASTSHVLIDPSGADETYFEPLGRYGDEDCGEAPLFMATNLPDPHYNVSIWFHNAMPNTNYPVVLKGFIIRTDVP